MTADGPFARCMSHYEGPCSIVFGMLGIAAVASVAVSKAILEYVRGHLQMMLCQADGYALRAFKRRALTHAEVLELRNYEGRDCIGWHCRRPEDHLGVPCGFQNMKCVLAVHGTKGDVVTRKSYQTLTDPDGWLNDELINFYMELIRDGGFDGTRRKTVVFNSFLIPCLKNGRGNVNNWYRKTHCNKDGDSPCIQMVDLLLFPMHEHCHWTLVALDFTACSTLIFDSTNSFAPRPRPSHMMNHIFTSVSNWALEQEHLFSPDHPRTPHYYTGLADHIELPVGGDQTDSSACGVFVCANADFTADCTNICHCTFEQRDIPNLRSRMRLEILRG